MKCRGLLRRTQLGWNNGLFINIYWVSQLIGLEYPAHNFKILLPWPGRRFNLICDSANAFEDKLMFWNPSHASEVTIPSDNVLVMHESVFGCVLDGVLIHACLRRLPSLRSHFTSALFAIDINLDLMKIALMIFYDEIVLSFSRIWRFIVFSFSLFMASLDKSWKETFAAKVRVDDFITGIWDFFECLANRNILLRLWWTISQSDQQHTFTTATSAEKSSSINDTTLVFRVPCLSHYRYLQSWVVCLSRFPRLFAHSVNWNCLHVGNMMAVLSSNCRLDMGPDHRHKKCFLFKFLTSGDHRSDPIKRTTRRELLSEKINYFVQIIPCHVLVIIISLFFSSLRQIISSPVLLLRSKFDCWSREETQYPLDCRHRRLLLLFSCSIIDDR